MNLKYTLGALISIPLLPIMYFQGKRIRATVPELPEAKEPVGKSTHSNKDSCALKIITIGESTIAGVGVETHEKGFTGSLANNLSEQLQTNIEWKVYAKSGYTAKRVAHKIIPNITEKVVDLIVVGLGGNDAFTLNKPKKWREDVSLVISKLQQKFPNTWIVFCNMPPIKEFPAFTRIIKFTVGNLVEILGKELGKIVQGKEKVFYYDEIITVDDWTKRLGIEPKVNNFFSDGVHPSQLTYQTWAAELVQVMQKQSALMEDLKERSAATLD